MFRNAMSSLDGLLYRRCICHSGRLLSASPFHRRKSTLHSSTSRTLLHTWCMLSTWAARNRISSTWRGWPWTCRADDYALGLAYSRTFHHRDKFDMSRIFLYIFRLGTTVSISSNSACSRSHHLLYRFLCMQCPWLILLIKLPHWLCLHESDPSILLRCFISAWAPKSCSMTRVKNCFDCKLAGEIPLWRIWVMKYFSVNNFSLFLTTTFI